MRSPSNTVRVKVSIPLELHKWLLKKNVHWIGHDSRKEGKRHGEMGVGEKEAVK